MELVNNGRSSSGQRKRKTVEWSSLPELLLWMVQDKLDIFDNKRFAAVCRDWRSASSSYLKVLQSVGDGLPWITYAFYQRNSLKFVSVARDCEINVDVPEHVDHIIFSKQGWILVQNNDGHENSKDSLFLLNPFTRAVIKLPPAPENMGVCPSGCFTTDSEGHPQRVFLIVFEGDMSVAIIKTASPGHEEWTDHIFPGHGKKFSSSYDLVTIGDYVYSMTEMSRITAFNVPDRTWKELRPPADTICRPGFIVENKEELLFVAHVYNHENKSPYYKFSSVTLYRYSVVDSSWKRVSDGDVKDTTFYSHILFGNMIATKGKGLKIYYLSQERRDFAEVDDVDGGTRVEVYDLLTGNRMILPVPTMRKDFEARWVDIG